MAIKIIRETKFKDITISIRYRNEISKESVIMKTMLSEILGNVCEEYPNKQAVSTYLNDLYGASFSSLTTSYGKTFILEFRSRAIESSYIENKMDLLAQQVEVMKNFILKPLLENGHFVEKNIEEAKRNLLNKIKRSFDEPSQLAGYKAITLVGEGQPIGINVASYAEDIEKLTSRDIYHYYQKMITEDAIDIIVMGDVDEAKMEALLLPSFDFHKEISLESSYALDKKSLETTYTVNREIEQAYIVQVYATHKRNKDDDFWNLYVANAILGMTPSSLLFREVREKHSLCYSIYSTLLAYDGALMIATGIDPKNLDQTLTLINEQVKRIEIGDFDDELLETSKLVLSNSFRNTKDDINGYVNMAYRSLILDSKDTVDDYIKKIEKVSKKDVMEAMRACEYISSVVVEREGARDENSK